MIGKDADLQDIILELSEIQPEGQPVDLLCEEELPAEQELEEEPTTARTTFKVVAPCGCCEANLRLFVRATTFGIRTLQDILTEELQLLCPECRGNCKHGGS
ncbi:E7 [Colobus guereza papillomavirus 2]|uniref:Protein E7 n=1 Tax=Colobus guereza papillomavirus 2 TaxID=889813 RepID=F8QPQ8_9PAPI|nr:E7 [Colobus guereza papillomavirus 2]ADQ39307.1 E7 [Colobus guereza papillomavirus 2]